MPFTLAHPSVVLPLGKNEKIFSMTGLISGSMIPDMEYFIRFKFHSDISHTLPGILWFDIPAALLMTFIFHLVIKRNLILNLPSSISSRLNLLYNLDWLKYFSKKYYIVLISVIAGIFTHIALDYLTYENSLVMTYLPFMKGKFYILNFKITLFKFLKYFLTSLLLVYGFWFIMKIPCGIVFKTNKSYQVLYWGAIILISFLTLLARFATGLKWVQPNSIVVTIITGLIIGSIIMGFVPFKEKRIQI